MVEIRADAAANMNAVSLQQAVINDLALERGDCSEIGECLKEWAKMGV
jgi:hypothetical protein